LTFEAMFLLWTAMAGDLGLSTEEVRALLDRAAPDLEDARRRRES
jgi:hypothetical protein